MGVPLNELFVAVMLIWLGAFLCMIPRLLTETETARLAAEYAAKQAALCRCRNTDHTKRRSPSSPCHRGWAGTTAN